MQSENFTNDIRQLLREELVARCRRNPRYSARSFARTLEMDPSNLIKVLRGKRTLGPRTTRRIAVKLGLSPEKVEALSSGGAVTLSPQAQNSYQNLALDQFALIADAHHYVILELLRVRGFTFERGAIARTLGITPEEVGLALERLQRLGILEQKPSGEWIDHSGGYSTTIGSDFTAAAFRQMQRQILEGALAALENVPMSKRDQSSMTMAIDLKRLPEARALIKDFRRKLDALLSQSSECTEVYHLSVSLFPVTQNEVKNA